MSIWSDDDDELMHQLGAAGLPPGKMRGPSSGGRPGGGYGKKEGCVVWPVVLAAGLGWAAARARGLI